MILKGRKIDDFTDIWYVENTMIMRYAECAINSLGARDVKKAVASGKLYKIEKGVYSDRPHEPTLAVIAAKYPAAVFTMNSAFYYHALTDDIPDKYYLATDKNASKIRDKRVTQFFENASYTLGAEETFVEGVSIRMYNKERMLIELLRHKNQLPFDYYKEILRNYRNLIDNLDIQTIEEYMELLPKKKMIETALQMEVF